jgi:alanyl aminopeptidase
VSETLVLTIDPKTERFLGMADIVVTLDQPRHALWLHGKGLHVTRVTATPDGGSAVTGTWTQHDDTGLAQLTLPVPLLRGRATLHFEYDAPFGAALSGLYKSTHAGVPYAVTQFEPTSAREAFPCFDEPGFKIPFDTTLVVPSDARAFANTREIERHPYGAGVSVHFAPTPPLPSYLVAFAVGPFDVVQAPDVPSNDVRMRPLPLRAITAKGRGREAAYGLAHASEILVTLERYFGLEYPYDKLDLLVVPGKPSSMENAGLLAFSETRMLLDETAALAEKRGYATTMAHELAHQWVGDLVTPSFWDDVWLNEAFATFVGAKAADAWNPSTDASTKLLGDAQSAMSQDSFVSARAVRQPVVSNDDIAGAFDSITYQKGASVLSMFERWVGPETFQRGLHAYLAQHRFGSATADDFIDAESAAAGKDVKTPFRTFLDQPGVPFVEAHVACDGSPRLHVTQSRFLPLGSTGNAAASSWQIPICARYGVGNDTKEACALLSTPEADLALGATCPDWVFPNADAAGYFRFSLPHADLVALRDKGFARLTTHERIAFGASVRAAYGRGALSMRDAIEASAVLVDDPHRDVVRTPMRLVGEAHDWLYDSPSSRAAVEAYGRTLFHAAYARLGWTKANGDDGDRIQLRSSVLGFLALTLEDPAARATAKRRAKAFIGYGKDGAIHPEALDANLTKIALQVLGEDADRPTWDALRAQFVKTEDQELRGALLTALSSARSPALVPLVRALVFDPALRPMERAAPVWAQLEEPSLHESTWQWVKANFEKLMAAVPGKAQLVSMGWDFCDEAHARDIETFFTPSIVSRVEGAPHVLASTLEGVRLCAARRRVQEPSARALFGEGKSR